MTPPPPSRVERPLTSADWGGGRWRQRPFGQRNGAAPAESLMSRSVFFPLSTLCRYPSLPTSPWGSRVLNTHPFPTLQPWTEAGV